MVYTNYFKFYICGISKSQENVNHGMDSVFYRTRFLFMKQKLNKFVILLVILL